MNIRCQIKNFYQTRTKLYAPARLRQSLLQYHSGARHRIERPVSVRFCYRGGPAPGVPTCRAGRGGVHCTVKATLGGGRAPRRSRPGRRQQHRACTLRLSCTQTPLHRAEPDRPARPGARSNTTPRRTNYTPRRITGARNAPVSLSPHRLRK